MADRASPAKRPNYPTWCEAFASRSHARLAKLASFVNAKVRDDNGDWATPLEIAVAGQATLEQIKRLLALGADPALQAGTWSVVELARQWDRPTVVKVLLNHAKAHAASAPITSTKVIGKSMSRAASASFTELVGQGDYAGAAKRLWKPPSVELPEMLAVLPGVASNAGQAIQLLVDMGKHVGAEEVFFAVLRAGQSEVMPRLERKLHARLTDSSVVHGALADGSTLFVHGVLERDRRIIEAGWGWADPAQQVRIEGRTVSLAEVVKGAPPDGYDLASLGWERLRVCASRNAT